jgi:hypothetical protein
VAPPLRMTRPPLIPSTANRETYQTRVALLLLAGTSKADSGKHQNCEVKFRNFAVNNSLWIILKLPYCYGSLRFYLFYLFIHLRII